MKIYFFVPSDRTKNPLDGFHQLPLPPPVVLDVPKTPSEIFELSQLTTKWYGGQKHHIDPRQSRDNSNKSFRTVTTETKRIILKTKLYVISCRSEVRKARSSHKQLAQGGGGREKVLSSPDISETFR